MGFLRRLGGTVLLPLLLMASQAEVTGSAVAAPAGTYRVDASSSRVTIKVGKAGLFKFAGHEHEVSALGFSGEVVADPAEIARSSVKLTFEASAVKVTGSGDSADDIPKVQATMSGPTVLDVARFPEIRFESRTVGGRQQADGSWALEVAGDLRLRSVARPLTLPLRAEISGDTLVASGRATLKQTDFGIEPVSVGGVVNVKNELVVEYRIVARKAP
jgi:polyisoprenoid-binding protein YceI